MAEVLPAYDYIAMKVRHFLAGLEKGVTEMEED